jgi:hypothetical protein
MRSSKLIVSFICLLFIAVLPARSANNPITALTATNNLYEWARLSRAIVNQGLTVSTNNPAAFVRHQLVQMSTANFQQREIIKAQIVALGTNATPSLITAITYAAVPAPIFSDSAVANITIFSMDILAEIKCQEAVPALFDFIDQFQTDVVITKNGKEQNQVVRCLIAITGQDFGKDKARWKKWYAENHHSGKSGSIGDKP